MDPLTELAIKYKTDKAGKHNYCPVYYDLFKHKRDKVKKVIEMGVAEGAGLRMFRDFFPNAMIYGGELDQKRIIKEDRIEVIECDQSFSVDLEHLISKTGGDIDLFVDDGSHLPQDQLFTCLTVMPILKLDTVYVIEDVADETIVDHLFEYDVNMIKLSDRYDDRLVIVRHKNG